MLQLDPIVCLPIYALICDHTCIQFIRCFVAIKEAFGPAAWLRMRSALPLVQTYGLRLSIKQAPRAA